MNEFRPNSAVKKPLGRRILFLRNSRGITDITGAESYLLNVLGGLSAAGCDVHLLCSDMYEKGNTAWLSALKCSGLPHTVVDVPGPFSIADFRAARDLVDSFRPDVLHAMDHRSNAVAAWTAARTGLPAIASFFGWTNWKKTTIRGMAYPVFDRTVMRRLSRILVDSPYVGRQVGRARGDGRVVVISNGVDLARFDADAVRGGYKTDWFGDESVWLVGMIGRLHPNKGHLDIAAAAARLIERHPQMRFVALGDPPRGYEGYASQVESTLRDLGIADRFLVTNVPSSEIPRAIASFDVTAIPSHMESLSYVMLESMAMKTPVVSADVGGHGDLIRHGENGFLFRPGDVDRLVALLSDLATDADLARRVGAAGFETVRSGYSTDSMIARTMAIYDEVAA